MTFHSETIIEPCTENIPNIPFQRLDFVPIQQIQTIESNSFVGLF